MKLKKLKIFDVQKNFDTSEWYIRGNSYEYLCICRTTHCINNKKSTYDIHFKEWNKDWTSFSPHLRNTKIYNVLKNILEKC